MSMQGLAAAPTTVRMCLQRFTAQEAAELVAHIFEGTAAPAAFLAQVLLPVLHQKPVAGADWSHIVQMFII